MIINALVPNLDKPWVDAAMILELWLKVIIVGPS